MLTQYDAVSFYFHLRRMKDQVTEENYQGHLWMSSAASDTIFQCAQERIFTAEAADPALLKRAEKRARGAGAAGSKERGDDTSPNPDVNSSEVVDLNTPRGGEEASSPSHFD
mgnify:CR=1 FL=1